MRRGFVESFRTIWSSERTFFRNSSVIVSPMAVSRPTIPNGAAGVLHLFLVERMRRVVGRDDVDGPVLQTLP